LRGDPSTLLSICIPTFNRKDFLKRCLIECIKILPDYADIVVTDNCSSDGTHELFENDFDSDKVKYFCNESNIGYKNLTKCLFNGDGKYCLLLSDEDELFDADWDLVKKQLSEDNNIGIFQFKYLDDDGKLLVEGPDKVLSEDSLACYIFTQKSFSFAGGTCIKHSELEKVWDMIDHTTLLWSLYSETLVPFYCSRYSKCSRLKGLNARRSPNRNNKGFMDTSSWKGKGTEPYWTITSRRTQNKEWISMVYNLPTSMNKRKILSEVIISEAIRQIYGYYLITHDSKYDEDVFFRKHYDVIERDRSLSVSDWMNLYKLISDELEAERKRIFGTYRVNINIIFIRIKRYIKLILHQLAIIAHEVNIAKFR